MRSYANKQLDIIIVFLLSSVYLPKKRAEWIQHAKHTNILCSAFVCSV